MHASVHDGSKGESTALACGKDHRRAAKALESWVGRPKWFHVTCPECLAAIKGRQEQQ